MIKKLILSSFVVVAFALYIFVAHHDDNSAKVTAPAATTTNSNPSSSSTTPSTTPATPYKDGSYIGTAADAIYGNIQVQATIQKGAITDVQFLQYPNDRQNSIEINTQAMPYLKQEAIKTQSTQIDIVTGATDSSQAFIQSLTSALVQARQ